MMNRFLHIGFDSYVDSEKIVLISACDTDKIRREMKKREINKNSMNFWAILRWRFLAELCLAF